MFRLVSSNDPGLNWELADTLQFTVRDTDRTLRRQDDEPLQRCLFERVFEKDFNPLEKSVAWYMDDREAVEWWHRLVARHDYHLQGWQRNKIYPDFLACLRSNGSGHCTFTVLETKGQHLKGNDDTQYKQRLFELLEQTHAKTLDAGEIQVVEGNGNRMIFRLILDSSWHTDLEAILGAA